jgi:O-antigen ligase
MTSFSVPLVAPRVPSVDPARPRLLLGAVLVAAAMPLRIPVELPVISSVSVLDLLLLVAAFTLVLDLPFRPLSVGYPAVFALLAVPVVACLFSLAWSQDRPATIAVLSFTIESLVAYLFVVRELEGLPPERIIALVERLVVLMIVPAVLLLVGTPGFEPRQPDLSVSSGDYLSYFTRLSHPILGRSNNLATILVVFVPVLLWWGHSRRRRRATVVGYLGLAALVATQSRGVLLSAVLAVGLYLLVRPPTAIAARGLRTKILAGTAVAALSAAAFYLLNPLAREQGASRFSGENVSLRITLLRDAFDHLSSHAWLGFGPGAVPDDDPSLIVDVHNTYVQNLLSFGVPLGVLTGLAVIALPLWFFLRARARTVPIAAVVGLALTIEAFAFAFESSFEGSVLRVIFYLSVGLFAELVRRVEAEEHGP